MKMDRLSLHLYQSQQLFFLALAIIMSFLSPSSSACPAEVFKCGNQTFEYPFGAKSSGCGDPALQLDCDHQLNMTLIDISGHQYYLLRQRKEGPVNPIRLVDTNMWGDSCNPSTSNHTMELWFTPHFRISDEYMNISLWGECREEIREYPATEVYALECNNSWYYSEMNLDTHCKSLVRLPAQKFDRSNKPLLGSIYNGFKIIWSISEGCEHCESKKELCIYDISNSTQLSCKSWSPDHAGGSDTANKTAIALSSSLGGVALMAALAVLCIWYVKRRKRLHTREFIGDYSNYQKNGMEAGYPMHMIGSLTIFPYEELQQATNFFDENNLLGSGGFGVVYLSKLQDGRSVAVKRLYQDSSRSVEKFMNEVQILQSLCHPSLVRLYGCTSPQSPMLLLVYEFMPNGTLSDHLHGSRRTLTGLPWATRLSIAIESAKALAYLHSMNPPIFHRDVKSTNILLDEHFRAKVADFGLSRSVPLNVSHVTTAPQGTPGYVDPEYHQCFQLTEKSDVYSLGVVLVEIISAKVAVDIMRNRNEISLANMATDKIRRGELDELVDSDLKIERNPEVKVSIAAVAELAFECLAIEREWRPTMKEVAARLTEMKEMLQESTESSNSISTTPTSSFTSPQENWLGIASD